LNASPVFFSFHFKGPSSQYQQKTLGRRLITFKGMDRSFKLRRKS
jgi:hypothetical protein